MQRVKLFYYPLFLLLLLSCNQKDNSNAVKQFLPDSSQRMNAIVQQDQSSMDMSWCPDNYPLLKMEGNNSQKLVARIIYSRPHKKGRKIFGSSAESLCKYGQPWRLGANEATEITFFENVNIAEKNIDKGTYVLYCIPNADKWTIILNSNLYTWGLHIDASKDIFKTDIPVSNQSPAVEDFTIYFADTKTGANLTMVWDNVKATLPLIFTH
jgi:Protein of unknown function (DUF2911)